MKTKLKELRLKILSSERYNYEKLNSHEIWSNILEDVASLYYDAEFGE